MSDKLRRVPSLDEDARPGESFLQRFHRRKTEARQNAVEPTAATPPDSAPPHPAVAAPVPQQDLTDADMPPLESLTVDSDYSGFLAEKVSEGLRRAALRKLFHSTEFNVLDELDDYAEDFTTFSALGDLVTADMRHRLEVEAKKRAEALEQAMLEQTESPDALTVGNDAPGDTGDDESISDGEQTTTSSPQPT